MRLTTVSTIATLAMLEPAVHAFLVYTRIGPTKTNSANAETSSSTSLAGHWMPVPISPFFLPDVDQMFEEMDKMMDTSLAATMLPSFPRLSSLNQGGMMNMLDFPSMDQPLARRPSMGFEIHQDEKEYKLAIKMPNVDAKDLNLHLDHDGRILRLRGHTKSEDGGTTMQSRFERSILLDPKVDVTQLSATVSSTDGVLTIVAPKLEQAAEALEKSKPGLKKIDIHHVVDDFNSGVLTSNDGNGVTEDETPTPKTRLAVEMPKNEFTEDETPTPMTRLAVEMPKNEKDHAATARSTHAEPAEKKLPARDFPY